MVLEGRLELPRIAPLAPQASASAIPPPEHIVIQQITAFTLRQFFHLSSRDMIFFHIFSSRFSAGTGNLDPERRKHPFHTPALFPVVPFIRPRIGKRFQCNTVPAANHPADPQTASTHPQKRERIVLHPLIGRTQQKSLMTGKRQRITAFQPHCKIFFSAVAQKHLLPAGKLLGKSPDRLHHGIIPHHIPFAHDRNRQHLPFPECPVKRIRIFLTDGAQIRLMKISRQIRFNFRIYPPAPQITVDPLCFSCQPEQNRTVSDTNPPAERKQSARLVHGLRQRSANRPINQTHKNSTSPIIFTLPCNQ